MNNETNNNTMKNLNLTKLEKQVLRNFIPTQNVNDFGEDVQKITLIMGRIFDNEGELLMPDTLKGVVGSLCKKDILNVSDDEGQGFNWIYLHDSFCENQTKLDELSELVKK